MTLDLDQDGSPRDNNDKVHDIPRVPERGIFMGLKERQLLQKLCCSSSAAVVNASPLYALYFVNMTGVPPKYI